jgi:hypothetical protein
MLPISPSLALSPLLPWIWSCTLQPNSYRVHFDYEERWNKLSLNFDICPKTKYYPATVCRTALFMTVQECCIAYCRCREALKLFRFLLSPYSLIGTCNSVQKLNVMLIGRLGGGAVNLCIILGSRHHKNLGTSRLGYLPVWWSVSYHSMPLFAVYSVGLFCMTL